MLSLIFEAGLYYHRQEILVSTAKATVCVPFVVVISHASCTWRRVALRNPFLCTRILFNTSQPTNYYHPCVERSKPCLLAIYMNDSAASDLGFDASILHRCRKLVISLGIYERAISILRCLRTQFCHLDACASVSLSYHYVSAV